MNFELPLAEEKVKKQQVVALHLIVAFTMIGSGAFLLLIQYLLKSLSGDIRADLLNFSFSGAWGAGIIIIGLLFLFLVIFKSSMLTEKETNRLLRIGELLVMLFFTGFAAIHNLLVPSLIYGLIAAAILFGIYWESVSDNTLYIKIDERGIRLPINSRRRFLEWWEVENVLLRFGILTIDCYDNRLFQWDIKTINFDKEDFQRFCSSHISENRKKRKNYAW